MLSTTGNAIAGVFGESETGTDRYRLVQKFDDASNATSGQTPGNVTFHSHGLAFRDPPPVLKPRAVPRAMIDGDDPGMTPQQVQADKDAFVAARDEYTALSPTERAEYLNQQRFDHYKMRYLDRTGTSEAGFSAEKYAGDKLGKDDADLVMLLMVERYGTQAGKLLRLAEKAGITIGVEGGLWGYGGITASSHGDKKIALEKGRKVGEMADALFERLKDNLESEWLEGLAKNVGLRGRHEGLLGKVDPQLDAELDELDQLWAAEVTYSGKASQKFVKDVVKDRATGGLVKYAPFVAAMASSMLKVNKVKKAAAEKVVAEAERLAAETLQKEQAAAKATKAAEAAPSKVTTPNAAARAKVQGEYTDPLTNKVVKTAETLAADHIFPKKLIKEMPGFDKLTSQQQSAILNNLENFSGLPKSLNSSKGSKIDWSTYKGQPIHPEYAEELAKLQEVIKSELQAQINESLKGK